MIGRMFSQNNDTNDEEKPRGFDSYDMRLGDVMRGERATLGKSLLDVQRELKIKASYISAVENADPSAFDSPGFIAGYVRSYARYLHLDPEWAFQAFCAESGFTTAHGMSVDASSARPAAAAVVGSTAASRNVFENPSTPFVPKPDSMFANIEAGAIGSIAVMVALVAGLGYGAYSIIQEVQQVEFTPVEQTPVVNASIDPLAQSPQAPSVDDSVVAGVSPTQPNTEALDRLYRPAALDVPVLTPRDQPIASIDPTSVGSFVESSPNDNLLATAAGVQVVEGPTPEVVLFAVSPTWVRVRGADGSILFEKVLDKGENYALPVTEETPTLRAGNSGSLYFKVNGTIVGPAGQGTSTVRDVQLASADLSAAYKQADPAQDQALFALLKELNAPDVLPASATPEAEVVAPAPLTLGSGEVSLFAVRPAWVRVRNGDGKVIFEKTLEKGEEYRVPAEVVGTTLRAGNSGSLYFRVGDQVIGPVGPGTSTARNVSLAVEDLSSKYQAADPTTDPALRDVLQ